MKTTLRYLLMVVAMVSFLSVRAQGLAQQPNAEMRSTSVMVGAGSTLPQAAVTGAVTTYDDAGSHRGHTRKGTWNPGGEPGPDEGENSEPWEDPLGDAMLPLMMAIAVYALLRVYMRRKRE